MDTYRIHTLLLAPVADRCLRRRQWRARCGPGERDRARAARQRVRLHRRRGTPPRRHRRVPRGTASRCRRQPHPRGGRGSRERPGVHVGAAVRRRRTPGPERTDEHAGRRRDRSARSCSSTPHAGSCSRSSSRPTKATGSSSRRNASATTREIDSWSARPAKVSARTASSSSVAPTRTTPTTCPSRVSGGFFESDGEDRLERQSYTHDAGGRLTGLSIDIDDDGSTDGTVLYEHDTAGNMIRRTRSGADGAVLFTSRLHVRGGRRGGLQPVAAHLPLPISSESGLSVGTRRGDRAGRARVRAQPSMSSAPSTRGARPCRRRASPEPRPRRLELPAQGHQPLVLAEGGGELDADRQTVARPVERHRCRGLPRGVEHGGERRVREHGRRGRGGSRGSRAAWCANRPMRAGGSASVADSSTSMPSNAPAIARPNACTVSTAAR